jgi:hypothetical protein
VLGTVPGNSPGEDLAPLTDELLETSGILVINGRDFIYAKAAYLTAAAPFFPSQEDTPFQILKRYIVFRKIGLFSQESGIVCLAGLARPIQKGHRPGHHFRNPAPLPLLGLITPYLKPALNRHQTPFTQVRRTGFGEAAPKNDVDEISSALPL